jgi:hypothetical protein
MGQSQLRFRRSQSAGCSVIDAIGRMARDTRVFELELELELDNRIRTIKQVTRCCRFIKKRPTAAWVERERECLDGQGRQPRLRCATLESWVTRARRADPRARNSACGSTKHVLLTSRCHGMAFGLGRVLTARSAPAAAGRAPPALVGDSRRSPPNMLLRKRRAGSRRGRGAGRVTPLASQLRTGESRK